jgi:hypothetical protein
MQAPLSTASMGTMKHASLFFTLTLFSLAAHGEPSEQSGASDACPYSRLATATNELHRLSEPPFVPETRSDEFRTITLVEQSAVSDYFEYAALIDVTNRQGWVYEYGGLAGVSNWYGPVEVDPVLASKCGPAKIIFPIGSMFPH